MSESGGKWVKPFDDGWVEYHESPPDAKMEEVRADVRARLAAFEEHKEDLLAILRNPSKGGTETNTFDEGETWSDLKSIASTYFWEQRVRKETKPSPADKRRKRLCAFNKAVGKARVMAERAMQDDVGDDLYSAWHEATVRYDLDLADLEMPLTLVRLPDEFRKVVGTLAVLEAAASHAAANVETRRSGKPVILLRGYIPVLAEIFQQSTGRLPRSGRGPFFRFVMRFSTALGIDSACHTIDDAIKLVLGKRRERRKRHKQPERRPLIPFAGSK
jgi:hypothetical protein